MAEPQRAVFVDVNRTRLRVWEWGDEHAPSVICAHGAYDHGRMWDGLAPLIADLGYRVLAPDLRGHGDSGRLGSGHAWAVVALDLCELARWAGPPVGLVGHSWGGGEAMYAAAVWPELVRWVVNVDGLGPPSEGFHPDGDDDLATSMARSFEWAERTMFEPPKVFATREDMVERRASVNVRLPREWVEHLILHGSQPVDGGFVWKADPMFRVGFPGGDFDIAYLDAEHRMVKRPVLVLTGTEEDAWSGLPEADIAGRVANLGASHEVIEGAGHYLHVEQPEQVLAAIERFVKEVDGG